MKIGFFDSGIGGVTVLYEAVKLLPGADFIYYADTKNVPYGPKAKEDVFNYIAIAMEFLVSHEVDAIVIACNTATSIAIERIRSKYAIPIIGMEPAVKPALENVRGTDRSVLVTGTHLTLKEEKLHNLIARLESDNVVELLPLPGLVQFAERQEFNSEAVTAYLKEQFAGFDLENCDTIVLGCTHFPYFKDTIKELVPAHVSIIDGSIGTAKNLKRIMEQRGFDLAGKKTITFYNSGVEADCQEQAKFDKLFARLRMLDEKMKP